MAKILEMPKLSPTMEEGNLTVWHKKEGDAIAVDDLLAEVETDKATMEFRSFDKGTLLKILVAAGQPGAARAAGRDHRRAGRGHLEARARSRAAPRPRRRPPRAKDGEADGASRREPERRATATTSAATPRADRDAPSASRRAGARTPSPDGRRARLALRAQARARARHRSRARRRHRAARAHRRARSRRRRRARARRRARSRRTPRPTSVRPLSMMRKTIARRLTESKQTVPHFYLTIDVDAAPIARLREQINADLAAARRAARARSRRQGLASTICSSRPAPSRSCACPSATRSSRPRRSSSTDASTSRSPSRSPTGSSRPVVRDADARASSPSPTRCAISPRAPRRRSSSPRRWRTARSRISNLGMFGIDAFAAVINPPEGAILAVGQIATSRW